MYKKKQSQVLISVLSSQTPLFSVEALCSSFERGSVSIKRDPKAALLLLAATLTNFCHLFHLSLQHSCGRNKGLMSQSPQNTTLQKEKEKHSSRAFLVKQQQLPGVISQQRPLTRHTRRIQHRRNSDIEGEEEDSSGIFRDEHTHTHTLPLSIHIPKRLQDKSHLSSGQSTAGNPCVHSKSYRSAGAEQREKVQVSCDIA